MLILPTVAVESGLDGTAELVVEPHDTAVALGSGDVEVLGTPRLVALCEAATLDAVRGRVEDGSTTVGLSVQIDHVRPTPVGERVVADAHLDRVEGRRLIFSVSAKDERGLVAAGKVTRVVIEVERFMEKTR